MPSLDFKIRRNFHLASLTPEDRDFSTDHLLHRAQVRKTLFQVAWLGSRRPNRTFPMIGSPSVILTVEPGSRPLMLFTTSGCSYEQVRTGPLPPQNRRSSHVLDLRSRDPVNRLGSWSCVVSRSSVGRSGPCQFGKGGPLVLELRGTVVIGEWSSTQL
jgi:hypothetical protein